MLRACVIDFRGGWDDYLPLVEFAYNNSYHSRIKMPPYEPFYGRSCKTTLCWEEPGDKVTLGPKVVKQTIEKI